MVVVVVVVVVDAEDVSVSVVFLGLTVVFITLAGGDSVVGVFVSPWALYSSQLNSSVRSLQ